MYTSNSSKIAFEYINCEVTKQNIEVCYDANIV